MGICSSTFEEILETVSPAFLVKWCATFVCSSPNCARSNSTEAFFSFRDTSPFFLSCGHLLCLQCRDSRLKDPAHSHFTCDKCNTSTVFEELELAHVVKEVVRELSKIGLPCSGCTVNHSYHLSPDSSTENQPQKDRVIHHKSRKRRSLRWKTSTIATASLFVSDAVMIKPDETAEEWTKRFFVLCQYCRASGATHSVKSECELHPFSDVYERHLHVEEFDEFPLMPSELTGRATWHLTMGSRKFVEKINRMRSCSRWTFIHPMFKVWREMTSHNTTELKFVHVRGKCHKCDVIHKPVRDISIVAIELEDVHGVIVSM